MDFVSKKILNETLGEKLKKTREEKQIDLLKIEELTGVQVKYLSALETGQYHKIPGEIYLKNFLKIYAETLNLNPEKILALFKKEQKILKLNFNTSPKIKNKSRLLFISNLIKKSLLGIFLTIFLFYIFFEIKNIIGQPKLIIQEPADNLIISTLTINVAGKTDNNSRVSINDQEILKNNDGSFYKTINLQSGLNLIKISAKKEHSREIIKYKKIMVK